MMQRRGVLAPVVPKHVDAAQHGQDRYHRRGSGRALFGLAETLKREGKEEEAQKVEAEYTTAWSTSDVHLTVEDL
jgi:hypothetical protein